MAPVCAKLCSAPICRKAGGLFSLLLICIVALTELELRDTPLAPFIDSTGPLLMLPFGALIAYVPMGDDLLLRTSFLANEWGVWLGAVSGSLFILHWPVRKAVIEKFWSEAPVAAVLLVQVLVAICFHHFVQKRINACSGTRRMAGAQLAPVEPGTEDAKVERPPTATTLDAAMVEHATIGCSSKAEV